MLSISPTLRCSSLRYLVKNAAILAAFFFTSMMAVAQESSEPAFVDGEILVMLQKGHKPEECIRELQVKNAVSGEVRSKLVSKHMGIYLISFPSGSNDTRAVLRSAYTCPSVHTAQLNHIIEQRVVPNDPSYSSQWQYDNNGSGGGTVDADIDGPEAWDVTTGGLTGLGDTIVVCVIDDGIDEGHADFGTNRWYNYAEIPNNGVDDDQNGYVDDFRGWSENSQDDVLDGGWAAGHGTPVAGIVGAKGDNGIGVTGVNWDVKLMIVQGGGNEAQAIAAYTYPLTMRKKYNQTNGAEGAFVVATNASWGIDNLQASSAPLWCAMYDTLGVHGILNAGATTNSNTNVDVAGDMPTSCGSDYLISVTNCDNTGDKVTSAGYGTTTIDLGAPGQGTYTVANNNSYGGFGGTSGATPHVTGVIALLYSIHCDSLIYLSRSNPGSAALKVKSYILNGGDANASLAGITTTGRTLNARGAIDLMISQCDTNGTVCFAPFGLEAASETVSSLDMQWSTFGSSSSMDLHYREVGSGTWTTISGVTSPTTINTLLACTQYEVVIESVCNATSYFSDTVIVQTDGCCESPDPIIASVSGNSMVAEWDPVTSALSYDVRYRIVGSSTWTDVTGITDTTVAIGSLASCTLYEMQVQTNCSGPSQGFGASVQFTSGDCGACVDSAYCATGGDDTGYEYIESVSFGTISNVSGDDNGYGDYTGNMDTFIPGQSYTITIEPTFTQGAADEYYTAWIDYNQDGDFADAGEEVFTTGPTQATASGSVTIPGGATTGLTRLRIAMRYNNAPPYCGNFQYGEVEDYCMMIGCDAAGVDVQSSCDSLVWIDGNTYYADNNTATYTYVGGAASGCDSVVTLNLDIVTIDVSVTANDPTYTANATGATYQWLDCDNNYAIIAGETSQTFNASQNGNYAVEVTQSGCVDTSVCEVASSVSILENHMGGQLNVYPNPTEGRLTVDLPQEFGALTLDVTNALGQVVLSEVFENASEFNFELSGPTGVYFVNLTSEGVVLARLRVLKK